MTWYLIPKTGLLQCHHEPEPVETVIYRDVKLPMAYHVVPAGVTPPTAEKEAAYLATDPFTRKGVKFMVDGKHAYETGESVYHEVE